jgi:AcrR family transcriptional regulator
MAAGRQLPGGRHGLSRQDVADHQRRRIMDAVVHVTVEDGGSALTVQRVLTRAGISRKTFYDHFANREAAVLATYRLVTEQLVTAIDVPAATDDRDPLADGVAALLTLVAARPDVARFCFVEAPRASADIAEAREALVTAFAGWLQRLGGRGAIRMRAAVGGLLETLAADPGDGIELVAFLRDVVAGDD